MGYISLKNVVDVLEQDDTIYVCFIYSFKSPKFWKVVKPMDIELSTGEQFTIPVGFTTDFCTVPKPFWSLFAPYDDALLGYIIHDYLYSERPVPITQKEADRELLLWSMVLKGDLDYDSRISYRHKVMDNHIRFWFCRVFGRKVWDRVWLIKSKNKR